MPPIVDEGPSPEDLRRFGGETGYCPDCGAQVWDQADVCPKCFAYLGGDVSPRRPFDKWWRAKWTALIVMAVLAAFVLIVVISSSRP